MADVTLPYTFTDSTTADADEVNANFVALRDAVNDVEAANLASTLAEDLGISQTSNTRRGYLSVATEQATSSASYTTLATADQIADIVVPSGGVLHVGYQAMWKESVNSAASAAIFIGSNQLKTASVEDTAPIVQGCGIGCGSTDTYKPLATFGMGLTSGSGVSDSDAYTGDVTTGMAMGRVSISATGANEINQGGWCVIHSIAAGTYTISIKFKTSSGTVTVKNRKLWVKVEGF